MQIHIHDMSKETGAAAARQAAAALRDAIAARGQAGLILATGASQFDMLSHLAGEQVDWSKVSAFHLDEYIGLPESHPASFRRYLKERFVERVPGLRSFTFVDGGAPDPLAECRRLAAEIRRCPIDLACIGIGENGHLAFNDPPADFDTREPYIVVELDEACRRQQLGEGWFPTLADVPRRAISMSIRHILASRQIVCTVPDARKAWAVQGAVEGAVTNLLPASILQQHPRCDLFLDRDSAAGLKR
jgi:glucosamine-6-phosphate deaminase